MKESNLFFFRNFRSLGLISGIAFLLLGGSLSSRLVVAQEMVNHGTNSVISGTVTADQGEIQAFRVKARDTVHRITYTVYTHKGRYQIFNLLPSVYEVQALEEGFESPVQKIDLKSGETTKVDLALKAKPVRRGPESMDLDALYPPGPARDILVESCFGCHVTRNDWFNMAGRTREEWKEAFQHMVDPNAWHKAQGPTNPPLFDHPPTAEQQDIIFDYLAKNFPPDHKRMDWKRDLLVRNEDALAEAIYIQYELPGAQGPNFADGTSPSAGFHDTFVDTHAPGILWLSGTGSDSIYRVDTHNLDFETRTQKWRIPTPDNSNVRPHGLIEANGLVYTANLADDLYDVTEFNPKTGGFRQYAAVTPGGGGHSVRTDSKGNVWFTTIYGKSRINRIDSVTKQVTEYDPVKGTNWYGIVVDKRDRVWAAGYSNSKWIPMYDPETNKWSLFPTSRPIRRVTVDSKGLVWGTQFSANGIIMVDPATGKTQEYRMPLRNGNPYEVWADLADNLWIDNAIYNSLVKFDQKTKEFTYFPYPVLGGMTPKMDADSAGTLWFGLRGQLTAFKPKGNVPMKSASK